MQHPARGFTHFSVTSPYRHRKKHDVGRCKAGDAQSNQQAAFFALLIGHIAALILRRDAIPERTNRLNNRVCAEVPAPGHVECTS